MKLLLLLTAAACMQASANGYSQTISLNLKNVSLEKVFAAIQQQSHYQFIYTKEDLKDTKAVSVEVNKVTVAEALDKCLKDQPLTYTLQEPYIIIKRKEESKTGLITASISTLRGKVINEKGEGIAGATVSVNGSTLATATNDDGEFVLKLTGNYITLTVSSIGYATKEVLITGRNDITVTLLTAISKLDETIVIAYGNTTRRLNTGNVSKVSGEEISKQPVSNPLAALHGRVPGLEIIQNSGMPGSGFTVQIRGQNSLTQGSDPLFVIDGVPFGAGNTGLNQQFMGAAGGLSPFNTINPSDIESIEVLKDADATAIYGSRGANGVILITTKKGKGGRTKVAASYTAGFSEATRTMQMLNTQQYLAMRREAFANDGIVPNATNAPDLLVWDTTKYTDFRKMFTGGSAETSDAETSVSGGNPSTQFLINIGYHKETGLLSKVQASQRASIHANINHASTNKKFNVAFTTGYSYNSSDLLTKDLTSYINVAPDFPLYDSSGNLNWKSGNTAFANLGLENPLAILNRKYRGRFQNLLCNLSVSYKILPGLSLKVSQGIQFLNGEETLLLPKSSLDPALGQLPSANFITSTLKSWQTEPQAEYIRQWPKSKLSILAGATIQELISSNNILSGYNYTSDLLLGSISAAGLLLGSNNYSQYKYAAFFGRINYNWREKYIVNITGRRDGSSRFGPGRQFANFGAAGGAYIFSKEKWVQQHLPFLSFGKWRVSYGITGNDQIGDYRFLDVWTSTSAPYQAIPGLQPSRLFNPDYGWEENKKWETGLELGFFKDRILLNASFFRNRSNNQLVNYALPLQTGFTSVQKNFNALIQNTGFELSLNSRNIMSTSFQWTTLINLTIPHNRLLSFPGLASTSYRSTFVVGQPLSIKRTFRYLGIDPATGIYQFTDADNNGTLDENDRISLVKTGPIYYGGLQNSFSYKGIQADIFIEFKKQTGKNYLATQSSFIPGYNYPNQPIIVLNRWMKLGQDAMVERFAASTASPAFKPAQSYLPSSDAIYGDASYLRVKTVSVSYTLPAKWTSRIHIDGIEIYLQAQNLFTITKYKGGDPESQSIYVMPPFKTMIAGLRLNL